MSTTTPNADTALIRSTQPLEPAHHGRPALHVDIKHTNLVDGPPSDGIRKIMKADMISTLAANFEDTDSLIIFTKASDVPRMRDVFSQRRFQIRMLQFLFAISNIVLIISVVCKLGIYCV